MSMSIRLEDTDASARMSARAIGSEGRTVFEELALCAGNIAALRQSSRRMGGDVLCDIRGVGVDALDRLALRLDHMGQLAEDVELHQRSPRRQPTTHLTELGDGRLDALDGRRARLEVRVVLLLHLLELHEAAVLLGLAVRRRGAATHVQRQKVRVGGPPLSFHVPAAGRGSAVGRSVEGRVCAERFA